MVDRIKSFEQLIVWQKAQELAVSMYEITKRFPANEKFALTNQVRRAANSVSANIAEGFGRRSPKDKVQFYTIAYGSLLEVKNYLYLAEKLGYINNVDRGNANNTVLDVQKLINALIKSITKNA
ncbi:MAG: four helix bundle protein [Candidatus Saccharimonadales bacterium]|jgi:four helix bundle protein